MLNKKGAFSKMGEFLYEKMIEDLQKELELKPKDKDLMFKLGIAYAKINKIEKAREIYKALKDTDEKLAKELLDIIYDA